MVHGAWLKARGSWLKVHGPWLMAKKGAQDLHWDPRDPNLDWDPGPASLSWTGNKP